MKIGFIGYGSMGSMIINGFVATKALPREDMIISTRTLTKLNDLKKNYPEIEIEPDNKSLASKSDTIFLFVNTGEVKNVLEEIKDEITPDTYIIHISAGLTLKTLSKSFSGKITRVIPSLTSEVKEGITLISHNQQVNENEKTFVETLFEKISHVKRVNEEDIEVGTDLTSCAPAFIAYFFKKFAESGAEKSNLTLEETEEMVIQTMVGTAKLLEKKKLSFEEIISRVATPGGITEEGLQVLEKHLPSTFQELFQITQDKRVIVKNDLEKQYETNTKT